MFPHPIFTLGDNLKVYWYGVWIAVGALMCFAVLYLYSKKKKINPNYVDFVFYNGIIAIGVGVLSSMLFQAFYNYLEDPSRGFRFGSGLTFIGGLIGGAASFLIGVYLFRKKYPGDFSAILPILPCCILIAHGFGRIGCFFAGCCYGKVTDSIFGVKFPNLSCAVYPTQLYEAIFLFIMFAVCSYLVLKKDFRLTLALYMISYGTFRFFIEFIRGDDRGQFIAGVTPSQFWSVFLVIGGIVLWFFLGRNVKKLRVNAQ